MSEPTNKTLYDRVVSEAKTKFKVWPSAYASMWVVKTYKSRGGDYKGSKKSETGTARWQDEKWINMDAYLKGKKVACGMPEGRDKACRPSVRINSSTPITASEVVAKHGKAKVQELVNAKQRDQTGTRINWNTGKITKK
jgi:hypothetical protein